MQAPNNLSSNGRKKTFCALYHYIAGASVATYHS